MLFNSLQFPVFFALVLALYFPLRRNVPARNLLLLAASYYFYSCWDWRFLGLLVLSTVVDFSCGLALDWSGRDPTDPAQRAWFRSSRRRLLLGISLAANLGMLGFFKYFNFFAENFALLFSRMGIELDYTTLSIVLPVGISFYTFQTLSYSIDLYKGLIPTERNPMNFALYVAFFPQLVAGPIERASSLLPQIGSERPMSVARLHSGFYLIAWGLFKKIVIGDNLVTIVRMGYNTEHSSAVMVLLAAWAFAIQVYCDFSGYSHVARGTARIMGFDLMVNFNMPYFATNPVEFIRRWHISLSSWIRDYLYIPLGGNRAGKARNLFNLFFAMAMSGLWHGANWTYILWGSSLGMVLVIYQIVLPAMKRHLNFKGTWWYVARVIIFANIWTVITSPVPARDIQEWWYMVSLLFSPDSRWPLHAPVVAKMAFYGALLFIPEIFMHRAKSQEAPLAWPLPVRVLFYLGLFYGLIFLGRFDGHEFFYFQF